MLANANWPMWLGILLIVVFFLTCTKRVKKDQVLIVTNSDGHDRVEWTGLQFVAPWEKIRVVDLGPKVLRIAAYPRNGIISLADDAKIVICYKPNSKIIFDNSAVRLAEMIELAYHGLDSVDPSTAGHGSAAIAFDMLKFIRLEAGEDPCIEIISLYIEGCVDPVPCTGKACATVN